MAEKSNFEKFAEEERTRLNQERDKLVDARQTIEGQIANVDRQLAAIAAGERALTGSTSSASRASRTTGRRVDLINLITKNPSGLTRGEILDKLDLKGNKSGEQSISNALNNLKKQGKLTQKDGRYSPA